MVWLLLNYLTQVTTQFNYIIDLCKIALAACMGFIITTGYIVS